MERVSTESATNGKNSRDLELSDDSRTKPAQMNLLDIYLTGGNDSFAKSASTHEQSGRSAEEQLLEKHTQQKCAGDSNVKCVREDRLRNGSTDSPTIETLRRALESSRERNAIPTEAEKNIASNFEKSLLSGNLKEIDQMLKNLADGPSESAERVLRILKEKLSGQNIDSKITFSQDQNGNRIANLELYKQNDWTKSTGFTTFSYSTNGEIKAAYKPTGNFFAPAVAVNPLRALTKIMYSKLEPLKTP